MTSATGTLTTRTLCWEWLVEHGLLINFGGYLVNFSPSRQTERHSRDQAYFLFLYGELGCAGLYQKLLARRHPGAAGTAACT